ncbi:hypothetical protein SVAN01_07542 [Stagonosporopsis vannaccii]|nr:hypothetical protein SVAN01_07542 [Stagonosporopsis vannaccii]
MILTTGLGTTTGNNQDELENKDPFVLTPTRKHNSEQYAASTTPATPNSKSTPLHKRFLEEVTMSPGTSSTPPRTPTRSPKCSQTPKSTLEVGQNGFYFSMEIPEKKIAPRSAATPEARASGRMTPSPDKQKRSEVKTGGRVRDILRKNLFGTPTKHTMKMGQEGQESRIGDRKLKSPSKAGKIQPCTSQGKEGENAQEDATKEAVTGRATAPTVAQDASVLSQPLTNRASLIASRESQDSATPQQQPQTPKLLPAILAPHNDAAPALELQKRSAASTPSNIGHLMANHSNKSSKVQTLPGACGLESMPTPLRKMSERLGLKSPNVVRKDRVDDRVQTTAPVTPKEQLLRSPISALDLRDATTSAVIDQSSVRAAAGDEEATATSDTSQRGQLMRIRSEQRLRQLLPSPITTVFPVVSSRPSPATTPYSSSPSTPSRPGLPRAKSFGTPSRLRSSMQEDMFKMQESLKRSLGPDAFQSSGSRPTTPLSPAVAPVESSLVTTNQSRGSPKKSARPISMVGPPKADAMKGTDTVPRRRNNVAERKPRPKSMIVGSAKVLETIASQVDSPRERANLRSAAAIPAPRQSGPTVSRPGTVASALRAKPTITKPPAPKPQHPVRTNKPAPPRPTAQPKRGTAPTQRTGIASAAISRPSSQNATDRPHSVHQPPSRSNTIRTKATSKPLLSHSRSRAPRTPSPELRDAKKDSGTATSYTPPGNPTRLPSPVKEASRTRLAVAGGGVTMPNKEVKPTRALNLTRDVRTQTEANAVRTPLPRRLDLGPGARAPVVVSQQDGDRNALQTPSKEVQSALDRAIDRKIREDRARVRGWL